MRALVLCSVLAAAVVGAACALTTDLSGFSEPLPIDGGDGASPADSGTPLVDGSSSLADAEAGVDYGALVRADGPVAYYRFEDSAGSNAAKDELGLHPAALTGKGVTFGGDGVSGHGASFDTTAALDVGDVLDFAGKVPFAIEMWVLPTTNTQASNQIVNKRDDALGPMKGYIVYLAGRTPHFEGWGVDFSAWDDTQLELRFTHVVVSVSYDAAGKGNAIMYVDSLPANHGGFDNTTNLADTAAHLRIGNDFAGSLDEVAFYDKALTADRVLAHYRAGKANKANKANQANQP